MNGRKVLLVVFLVGLAEALAVAVFHRFQLRSGSAAILSAQIQSTVNRLDALEWKALARGKLNEDLLEEVAKLRAQMDHYMSAWSGLARDEPLGQAMKLPFEVYAAAVDKEFSHLKKGELAKARWHDEHQVDPAFLRLQQTLRQSELKSELRARQFSRWDTWGTFSALFLATALILVLLRHFLKAQELKVKADADRRLLEESQRNEAEIRKLNESLERRVAQRTRQLQSANENLETQMSERRHLERLLQQVSEQEKRRLGEDLHDGVCQLLTGAAMRSKALEERLSTHPEAGHFAQVTQLVTEALRMARNSAWLLYPMELEKNGLVAAIHALSANLHRQSGLPCRFEHSPGTPSIDPAKAIHLYRIAQEAMANALRHGHPSRVLIRLSQQERRLGLEVENDGPVIGTTPDQFDGMGCRIMKYRASIIGGTLQIVALQAGGCQVRCSLTV